MKQEIKEEIYEFEMQPSTERFYNDESFFGIYKFGTKKKIKNLKTEVSFETGKKETVGILIGSMQKLNIGMVYNCKAKLVYNKKYNEYQMQVISVAAKKPTDLESQQVFLKSIITEKQAESLLEKYPQIVEMVIEGVEVDLKDVKGIKEKTFSKIKQKIEENYIFADLLAFLAPLGLSIKTIKTLKEIHPNVSVLKGKLEQNPYLLLDVHGMGWKRVDDFALNYKPELKLSDYRVKFYIKYKLNEIANDNGHTRVGIVRLNKAIKEDLPECEEIYNKIIEVETSNADLLHMNNDDEVGLRHLYNREVSIFNMLSILQSTHSKLSWQTVDFNEAFEDFAIERGYNLTAEQKEAVTKTHENNVNIIAGSAGTGKSSVIYAILKAYPKAKISMAALSAKASQRMTEVTGMEATTIHRLLGFTGTRFAHNEDDPIDADIVIIDEASMINSQIFLYLLKAIKPGTKLIICFDYAQLPPIGAGNVATDLLKSKFSVTILTQVHRQAAESGILSDANIIRFGRNPIKEFVPQLITGALKDMFYVFKKDKEEIFNTTIKYYLKSLESTHLDEICICTPRKGGTLISTQSFNNAIQDILLKDEKKFMKYKDTTFKLGAKVIQKTNDYEKEVFNGEVGYISLIDIQNKMFSIKFKDREIQYDLKDLENIDLAYALTIHSTQGSQYEKALVVFDMSSFILLSKELLYTAITRASKRCMVIADPKAFDYACKTKAGKRNTWLQEIIY